MLSTMKMVLVARVRERMKHRRTRRTRDNGMMGQERERLATGFHPPWEATRISHSLSLSRFHGSMDFSENIRFSSLVTVCTDRTLECFFSPLLDRRRSRRAECFAGNRFFSLSPQNYKAVSRFLPTLRPPRVIYALFYRDWR